MRSFIFLALVSTFTSKCYVSAKWMNNIPDNKYLSELTIPGTHDSYARYGNNAFAAPYAICQDWTVEKQLEEGIRFFDVRFRPFKNSFTVHHGPVWQKKYGGDVFREFKDFLKKNPRETVLFSYKDETNGNPNLSPEPGSDDFKNILRGYLNNNDFKPWIYGKNNGENDGIMPTLGQARGKMVLIDKNGHGGWGLRNLAVKDDWQDPFDFTVDTSGCKYDPTYDGGSDPDCFKTNYFIKHSKINGIKNNMRKAGKSKSKLYLSFCSASSAPFGSSNRNIANRINPKIKSFIRESSGNTKQVFGVVIFDFPTPDIIRNLIQYNPGQKKVCATLENESRTNSWMVTEGTKSPHPGRYWKDNIAYVNLNRGCYLAAWVDMNYEGTKNYLLHKKDGRLISKSSNDYLIKDDGWIYRWWANDISSFKCYCS